MIAIYREKGTIEITEQRLADQVRVNRTNKWLTGVKLEEIRRKFLTPRDGDENQKINDILAMEECVDTEITMKNVLSLTC